MWLMIETIRGGELVKTYFRSKEEADNFFSQPTMGKTVSHKLVGRHCGKLVTDPPEPRFIEPELEDEGQDMDDLELAEEYYLNPEIDVDDWESYTDSDYEES